VTIFVFNQIFAESTGFLLFRSSFFVEINQVYLLIADSKKINPRFFIITEYFFKIFQK